MTRDYPFYDYGLILSTEILEKVAEKLTEKEHTENNPYTIEDAAQYFDNCLSSVSDFTGSTFKIDAEGNADEDEYTIYYTDDSVYYVPFKKEPTLQLLLQATNVPPVAQQKTHSTKCHSKGVAFNVSGEVSRQTEFKTSDCLLAVNPANSY